MLRSILFYLAAAVAEIAGCYGFWVWQRQQRPLGWAVAALSCLALFAWLLTKVDAAAAGRAYAAYGGIYIVAALVWLWTVDGVRPDRWDLGGGAVCLLGAALILFGPRTG